jgi:UDP-3-O-[3-hydroxymyristoyl] glucosamine N-acyltransferase
LISKLAVVETGVIGHDTRIEEFAVVRAGAELGNDVFIHPHVIIEDGVVIGDGVEIFPGTYIRNELKGAGVTARRADLERKVTIGAN